MTVSPERMRKTGSWLAENAREWRPGNDRWVSARAATAIQPSKVQRRSRLRNLNHSCRDPARPLCDVGEDAVEPLQRFIDIAAGMCSGDIEASIRYDVEALFERAIEKTLKFGAIVA